MRQICVFCGSSKGRSNNAIYVDAAQQMGLALVRRSIGLVYGGGNIGLMGSLADTVLEAGGRVTGVIPQALLDLEVGHAGLTELHVVESMHERKAMMAELSDGFVAMPGGYGTLDEFCEVVTWAQLGIHRKPCALLNVEGYYDHLLALFDHATAEGFVDPIHRSLVLEDSDPERLLDRMDRYLAPALRQWIDRVEQ